MGTSPGYIRLATSATRSLFETAFDAVSDPVVVVDARSAHVPIVLANAAARREFKGESADDSLIEKSVYALLVPESVSTVQALLEGSSEAVGCAHSALSWRLTSGVRALPTDIQCLDCASGQRLLMLSLRLAPQAQPPLEGMAAPRSAEFLAQVQSVAGVGGWEYDFATERLSCTPEAYRLAEVSPDRFTPTLRAVRGLCSPDSLRRFEEHFARALAADGRFDLELEIRTSSNAARWLRLIGRIDRREGRPSCAWGSLQDIQQEWLARRDAASEARWAQASMDMAHLQAWRWHEASDVLEYAGPEGRDGDLAVLFPTLAKLLRRVHPQDRGRLARQFARAGAERAPVQDEFRLKMNDGRYRWYALAAQPFLEGAERPPGLVGVLQDITARQESQARLRESEALLRLATANTADTLVLLGVDLKVRYVNRGFRGLAAPQILGRDVGVLLPESARLAVLEKLRHVLKTGEKAVFDFDFGADSEGPRFFENRAVLVTDESIGRGISLTLSDITDRKRLEKEILDVSSRERHSIGRDLHDGLGQELTGVALMLRGLATRLQRQAPDAVGYLDEVVALVNQSIETTRGLARGLLPVCTESGGLPYALEELAARSRARYGLDVSFRAEIWPALTLSERDASHLYRIAQEALTNAARHAKPTRVEIFLLVTGSTFLLSISDDGVGYGNSQASEAGMGLKIMSYRASMIGAKFDIFPGDRGGTVVRITGDQPLPPITL